MGDDLEGPSEGEITARTLETKLEGIMQSRQWLLTQRRVYESSCNIAEQDAIALIDEMLAAYDRVLKQLTVLIRRARIREVGKKRPARAGFRSAAVRRSTQVRLRSERKLRDEGGIPMRRAGRCRCFRFPMSPRRPRRRHSTSW